MCQDTLTDRVLVVTAPYTYRLYMSHGKAVQHFVNLSP